MHVVNQGNPKATRVTLDTVLTGVEVRSSAPGEELILRVGLDVKVGDTVAYQYNAIDGGYYCMLDSAGGVLAREEFASRNYSALCGGVIVADSACRTIAFGSTVSVLRKVDATVGSIIKSAASLEGLYKALEVYTLDESAIDDVIHLYLDNKVAGTGGSTEPPTDDPGDDPGDEPVAPPEGGAVKVTDDGVGNVLLTAAILTSTDDGVGNIILTL